MSVVWVVWAYATHMTVVVWAYVSHCCFVALYVQMFVAGANKVERSMSWCVGTNEILASNY